jgi:hypothetical protein
MLAGFVALLKMLPMIEKLIAAGAAAYLAESKKFDMNRVAKTTSDAIKNQSTEDVNKLIGGS